jgi:hypothetical protein
MYCGHHAPIHLYTVEPCGTVSGSKDVALVRSEGDMDNKEWIRGRTPTVGFCTSFFATSAIKHLLTLGCGKSRPDTISLTVARD